MGYITTMQLIIHMFDNIDPLDLSVMSKLATTAGLPERQDIAAHGWLPLAMTDPALLHGILSGSALYFNLIIGREDSVMFQHMKESVHLISIRLQNLSTGLSDSTLVTVAHLADFEVSSYLLRI
jgi:hypothetical protein